MKLRFSDAVQQILEVFVGFTGEADDEGGTQSQVGADFAPTLDACHCAVFEGRALHGFQYLGAGMLEGNVQVRQYLALGHQGNDFVDMRVGIHLVQPRPDAALGPSPATLRPVRRAWAAVPEPAGELDRNSTLLN